MDKIVVGPNVLVSRDGDVPHVELMVAANPKNRKNLLGTGITFTRPGGGTACRTYASTDGGYSWTAAEFPEQMKWGGADPQVAFGIQGTAYFADLAIVSDEQKKIRAAMHFIAPPMGESIGIHRLNSKVRSITNKSSSITRAASSPGAFTSVLSTPSGSIERSTT